MAISKLEKDVWHPYFDNMAHLLEGKRVDIEIDALAIGSQQEASWLPLLGIVYDYRNDLLEVALEGLDHLIYHPSEIFVDQNGVELLSMEVIDADAVRHIIKLRDPLMLPQPMVSLSGTAASGQGART